MTTREREQYVVSLYRISDRIGDGHVQGPFDSLDVASSKAKDLARANRDHFARIERRGDWAVVGRDIHLDWWGRERGEIRFGQEWSW